MDLKISQNKKKFIKGQIYSKNDPYYRGAKEQGFRARSAFKLIQVNEEFNIFKGVKRAVDLCSAPGSWSQVLSQQLYETDEQRNDPEDVRVASVDLQEVAPIPGVSFVMGDITTQKTAQAVLDLFKGNKADLIISDGAPDVTGFHEIDQYMQAQLLQAALVITQSMLREGGTFVAKFFKGADLSYLDVMMKQLFQDVYVVKPQSSRSSSAEAFVVGLNYKAGKELKEVLSTSMMGLKDKIGDQKIEEESEEEDVLTF